MKNYINFRKNSINFLKNLFSSAYPNYIGEEVTKNCEKSQYFLEKSKENLKLALDFIVDDSKIIIKIVFCKKRYKKKEYFLYNCFDKKNKEVLCMENIIKQIVDILQEKEVINVYG